MTLEEFREHTKDLPANSVIYVLAEGVWRSPVSLKTRTESILFVEGQVVADALKGRVEIQLELPK